MSNKDDLLALKRKLEGDLYVVNRALALLGQKNGTAEEEKNQTTLFSGALVGNETLRMVFDTALNTMGDNKFKAQEMISAMRQLQPGRTINEGAVFTLLWKAAHEGKIKTVQKKRGLQPAIYIRGDSNETKNKSAD